MCRYSDLVGVRVRGEPVPAPRGAGLDKGRSPEWCLFPSAQAVYRTGATDGSPALGSV